MVLEWVNDGARGPGELTPLNYTVVWTSPDAPGARVVSTYTPRRNRAGRYEVVAQTSYAAGEWTHTDPPGEGAYHDYETKREALAWARRDAELEASNTHAISWDGRPT